MLSVQIVLVARWVGEGSSLTMRYPVTACFEIGGWAHEVTANNDIAIALPINCNYADRITRLVKIWEDGRVNGSTAMVHTSAGPTCLRAGVSEPRAIENHHAQPCPTTLDAFDKTFNTSLSTNPPYPQQYRQNGWCYRQGRRGTRAHDPRTDAAKQRIDTTPQAQKFIAGYAAFLKRQGKLPMYVFFFSRPVTILASMLTYSAVQVRVNPAGEGNKPESRRWGIIARSAR
jgi:hypothetical protein